MTSCLCMHVCMWAGIADSLCIFYQLPLVTNRHAAALTSGQAVRGHNKVTVSVSGCVYRRGMCQN